MLKVPDGSAHCQQPTGQQKFCGLEGARTESLQSEHALWRYCSIAGHVHGPLHADANCKLSCQMACRFQTGSHILITSGQAALVPALPVMVAAQQEMSRLSSCSQRPQVQLNLHSHCVVHSSLTDLHEAMPGCRHLWFAALRCSGGWGDRSPGRSLQAGSCPATLVQPLRPAHLCEPVRPLDCQTGEGAQPAHSPPGCEAASHPHAEVDGQTPARKCL